MGRQMMMKHDSALVGPCRTCDLAYLTVIILLAFVSALAWLETHPTGFVAKRIPTTTTELSSGLAASFLPAGLQWDAGTVDKLVVRLPAAPSSQHWLGTDDRGRDVLARWLSATWKGLVGTLGVMTMVFAFALLVGALPVFYSLPFVRVSLSVGLEITSSVLPAISNTLGAICRALPFFFLTAAVAETDLRGPSLILVLWGVFAWPGVARQVAEWTRQWAELPHVSASVISGVSNRDMVVRHLLPYLMPRLAAVAPRLAIETVSVVAAMQYLGLGSGMGEPTLAEFFGQFREYGDARFLVLPTASLVGIWVVAARLDRGFRGGQSKV